MEFLDSIDQSHTYGKQKKSRRVRSWYLYEQYKALETNQSYAAKRLKHKFCQDKILHQELWERRARRDFGCGPRGTPAAADSLNSVTSDYYDTIDHLRTRDKSSLLRDSPSRISLAPSVTSYGFEPSSNTDDGFGDVDLPKIKKKHVRKSHKIKHVTNHRQKSETTLSLVHTDSDYIFHPDAIKDSHKNLNCFSFETINPKETCKASKASKCPKYHGFKGKNCQKEPSYQDLNPEIISPNLDQINLDGLSDLEPITDNSKLDQQCITPDICPRKTLYACPRRPIYTPKSYCNCQIRQCLKKTKFMPQEEVNENPSENQNQPSFSEGLHSNEGFQAYTSDACQNQQCLRSELAQPKELKGNVLDSVKTNFDDEKLTVDDLKEELESVRREIDENISKQMSAEKEKRQCLERYTELCSMDNTRSSMSSSGAESQHSESMCSVRSVKKTQTDNGNISDLWEKVVSFAHQLVQLNHGNCYYDYGSQFMTAILACDMICRGINRTCRCLQRYVLPIEFNDLETPEVSSSQLHKKSEREKNKRKHKSPHRRQNSPKLQSRSVVVESKMPSSSQHKKKYSSESNWRKPFSNNKNHGSNGQVSSQLHSNEKSTDSFFMDDFKSKDSSDLYCSQASHHTVNPMLKISDYFDSFLAENT